MPRIKKLLPIQGQILQAPLRFPETKFFFTVAGYGSGKTSGLAYAILNTTKMLLGKKDLEGHNPKIMIASKNLTFLKKTLTGLLEQDLRDTNSEYRWDKASNLVTIGESVEWQLIPAEDEGNIYGFSVVCIKEGTKIMTSMGEKNIEDITDADYVLTRKGFRKVRRAWCNGIKDCIKVNVEGSEIICTPDHRFIDSFDNEIEAKDLTETTPLVKIDHNTQSFKPAHLTAKTSSVVGQYKVYDIEVEDCHEFFANGVLVHNCTYLDELDELPTQTAMAVVKAVNERTRQSVEGFRSPFIMMCTSSQGLKGTYQTVMHFKNSGISYVLMRGRTRDNIYLQKDYVDNMYKIYNEKERRCYLDGEFVSVDTGLVFSDYDAGKNLLEVDLYDELLPDDTVYIGQDFNNFGCAGVACVIKNGAVVVVKDYDIPDIRKAPEIFRYDFPTQPIVWIPDATATQIYSQFKKELRAKNIRIAYRKSNPLVQDRVFAINKLMYVERMFITPICKNVEKALLTHQFDPKTNVPMKGGKGAPDHWSDAMGYAVYYIMCWRKELKDLYDVTIGRNRQRRLGSVGVEIDADYRLMRPESIKTVIATNMEEDTDIA